MKEVIHSVKGERFKLVKKNKIDIAIKIQLRYFKSRLVPRKQIVMQQMLYNYILHSIKLTLTVI